MANINYLQLLGMLILLAGIGHANVVKNSVLMGDKTGIKLERAINYSGKKQALYSYNIANSTTQGFIPLLLPEDRAELERLFDVDPENQEYLNKVMIEHFMAKIAENNKRQQALYTLYKKRVENMRKVVTLGKQ